MTLTYRDGVHQTHCCLRHGCKYALSSDDDCPVEKGRIVQDHPCEQCDWEQDELPRWLALATYEQLEAELDRRQVAESRLAAKVETASVMDREDYWDFVGATPPEDEYGAEILSGNNRLFWVAVDADNSDEAEMRAVQVARYSGEPEAISVGVKFLNDTPVNGVPNKRWAVQIEAW